MKSLGVRRGGVEAAEGSAPLPVCPPSFQGLSTACSTDYSHQGTLQGLSWSKCAQQLCRWLGGEGRSPLRWPLPHSENPLATVHKAPTVGSAQSNREDH